MIDADGDEFVMPEGDAIVSRGCGQFQNRPFCKGPHRGVGFHADDVATRAS